MHRTDFKTRFLFTLLIIAGLAPSRADWPSGHPPDEPAYWPPFTRTIGAEIGGDCAASGARLPAAQISTAIDSGDLSLALALRYDEALCLSGLSLRHPMVSLGFLERGDLLRLLSSPAGSWNRAPAAALANSSEAAIGDQAPEKYGIVISPLPGRASFFSFFEPACSVTGLHTLFNTGSLASEFLTALSRPRPSPPPEDSWLVEHKPPAPGALYHCLFRLSLALPGLELSGGAVVAAARLTAPQLAASFTVESDLKRLKLSANMSGGMGGYFGINGKSVAPPLEYSWRVSTGKLLPVVLFLDHVVKTETLPLYRIPFRAMDETARVGFEFDMRRMVTKGSGEIHIKTDRSGWQELSSIVDFAIKFNFEHGYAGITARVCREQDSPLAWSVGLPLKTEVGSFTLSVETDLSACEDYRLESSVTVHGEAGRDASWYISTGASVEKLKTGGDTGAGFFVTPRYRIGWKAKA